jgi:hypothetical protein
MALLQEGPVMPMCKRDCHPFLWQAKYGQASVGLPSTSTDHLRF